MPAPPAPDDRWLSVAETAVRLGVSPSTLRWWRHKGRGPLAVLIGSWHKYLESDVIAYEKRQRQAAQDARDRWTQAARRAS